MSAIAETARFATISSQIVATAMPITIFKSFARVAFVCVLVALAPSSRPTAQAADPRGDFLNALGQCRVNEAITELAAARAADPARPEVPLLQGLVHAQITGDRSATTEALKATHALNPNDPTRTYLLARHLIEIDQREAGVELLRQVQHSADQIASGAPTSPFIRLDLVRVAG